MWAYRLLEHQIRDWRDSFKCTSGALNERELRILLVELDVTRTVVQTQLRAQLYTQESDSSSATQEMRDPSPATPIGAFVAAVRMRLPNPVVDALVDTYFAKGQEDAV